MSIAVVLADDHIIVRTGIRQLLELHPDIRIVGEYERGGALLSGLRMQQADVLLLDLQLGDMNGDELLPVIRKEHAQLKILILSSNESLYSVKRLMDLGADGYLFKNSGSELLLQGIMHVHTEGTPFLADDIRSSLRRRKADMVGRVSLTPREVEVLTLIVQEYTNREIGSMLNITHRTVEIYRQGIMQKLDVNNMVGMVKKAILLGLVQERK